MSKYHWNMETIRAIIEKSTDGGYSIYSKGIKGVVGSGLTEAEAKEDFEEVLKEEFEYYKERTGKESKYLEER